METDKQSLIDDLVEANRVLTLLGTLDRREHDTILSRTLRDGLRVYFELLAWKDPVSLPQPERDNVFRVTERLRATLQFFGEDV